MRRPVMTSAVVKRGKRISKARASHLISELLRRFDDIAEAFGSSIAVDLFELVLQIHRENNPEPKRTRGRPRGAVDADRDTLLLATFNARDPQSLLSQARRGLLVIGPDRQLRNADPAAKPKRINREQLAECLYRGFRLNSASALLDHLKELKRAPRRNRGINSK